MGWLPRVECSRAATGRRCGLSLPLVSFTVAQPQTVSEGFAIIEPDSLPSEGLAVFSEVDHATNVHSTRNYELRAACTLLNHMQRSGLTQVQSRIQPPNASP